MRKPLIGVMGPGSDTATKNNEKIALELGQLIAKEGWYLLSGGVNGGVMATVNKGAKEAGGFTVGILPSEQAEAIADLDVPIQTNMSSARNNINALSSDVMIAVGINPGTTSEIAFALQPRANTPVVLLDASEEAVSFFKTLRSELIKVAYSPQEAISIVRELLNNSR